VVVAGASWAAINVGDFKVAVVRATAVIETAERLLSGAATTELASALEVAREISLAVKLAASADTATVESAEKLLATIEVVLDATTAEADAAREFPAIDVVQLTVVSLATETVLTTAARSAL